MNNNQNKLNDIITDYQKICIAFSGGVDSTLLLYLASRLRLVIAVMIDGVMVPREDIKNAENFAHSLDNVTLVKVPFDPLTIKEFKNNTKDRCYFCKKALFNQIIKTAKDYNCDVIFDGSNLDDLSDYRPGLKALEELNIVSPFIEADFNKELIYNLSNLYELPTKNKPSSACLASRIPTGEEVTAQKLKKIEEGEKFLKQYGFKQLRLRLLNPNSGYIEILREDFPLFEHSKGEIVQGLSNLDIKIEESPHEYKQGAMNGKR